MEISLEQVIKEYEKGISLKQISKKMSKSISMIKSELVMYGGEKGQEILLQELEKELPMIKIIIEKYQQGETIKRLSKQYQISTMKIYDAIGQYQVITGKIILSRKSFEPRDDLHTETIVEEYRKGKTLSQLADDNDTSITTIRNRVNKYIEEHGNQIEVEHNKSANQKDRKNRIPLPIEEIKNKRKQGETFEEIGKYFHVSGTTIQNRLKENKKKTTQTNSNPSTEDKKIKTEINNLEIIDLDMIIKYFELGYNLDEVQEFVKENGHKINESDIEIARKIENGELKVATEASIEKIIEKYGYSYEQLTEIAEKKNYLALKKRYISAKANINNKNEKGVEK